MDGENIVTRFRLFNKPVTLASGLMNSLKFLGLCGFICSKFSFDRIIEFKDEESPVTIIKEMKINFIWKRKKKLHQIKLNRIRSFVSAHACHTQRPGSRNNQVQIALSTEGEKKR